MCRDRRFIPSLLAELVAEVPRSASGVVLSSCSVSGASVLATIPIIRVAPSSVVAVTSSRVNF